MAKLTPILLALGLTCLAAPAVNAAEAKIGVIDMRAVVTNSPHAKAAMEKLKNEFKAREEKIMAQEKSLKEKSEKLQRNSAVMSEAEKAKLEKDVMAGQRDLQRMQAEYREDAAMRQQEEMKKVIDKVTAAIDDIAKKDKYDLIFVREAAPYASKQMDITEKVIKATAPSA